MDVFLQILISGLTLGAMYAVSSIGLALVWGSVGMINMAHGVLLTFGGYATYGVVVNLGMPLAIGFPAAMAASAAVGLIIYYAMIQFMYLKESFETNVIIATLGLSILLENIVLKIWGAYPFTQPIAVSEGFRVSNVYVPYQNLVILGTSLLLMIVVAWLLNRTRMGRAIRATAQSRDAAQLMGVNIGSVFAQIMALAGVIAAVSGVMLSSLTTLAPTMGHDPMLKAFIICIIAGQGNIEGSFYSAFFMGLFEASIQYFFGVRFGFPALLLLVILALMWRPYGIFGKRKIVRA
jgi:branched-subunit amino acid ABC-type transport system permease component